MKLQRNEAGEVTVTDVTVGGAAQSAGVKTGDVLECINGKNVLGATVRDVVPLLQVCARLPGFVGLVLWWLLDCGGGGWFDQPRDGDVCGFGSNVDVRTIAMCEGR